MSDKTSNEGTDEDDIQALSQRFLKLWQDQLSLMGTIEAPQTSPEDWMTHWSGLMKNGQMQGGMPVNMPELMDGIGRNMRQQMPADLWKSMMPGYATENSDSEEKKKADDVSESRGSKAGTDEANRSAPAGASSDDVIGILRQLTSYVERLDQRLTKLEQQAVSSDIAKSGGKSGKGSAKKPKAKQRISK